MPSAPASGDSIQRAPRSPAPTPILARIPTPVGPERLLLCLKPVGSPARPSAPEDRRAPQASEARPGPGSSERAVRGPPERGRAPLCTPLGAPRRRRSLRACVCGLAPAAPRPPRAGAQTPVHARWSSHAVRIPRALLPGDAPSRRCAPSTTASGARLPATRPSPAAAPPSARWAPGTGRSPPSWCRRASGPGGGSGRAGRGGQGCGEDRARAGRRPREVMPADAYD